MMRRLMALSAMVVLLGCHPAHPLTKAQVVTIILDAGYGVEVGCVSGWLEPPVCDIAQRVLLDARTAAEAVQDGWQASAKAVLVVEEGRLPADSKLRPYFDAVISLL